MLSAEKELCPHETAHRLIQLSGQVFRFAIASGRARHNIAADLKDALRPVKVQHRASITDPKKIGVLLRTLDEYSGHFSVIYALRLIPHLFTASYDLLQSFYQEKAISESEMKEVQRIILATYPDQNKLPALVTDPDKKGCGSKFSTIGKTSNIT